MKNLVEKLLLFMEVDPLAKVLITKLGGSPYYPIFEENCTNVLKRG